MAYKVTAFWKIINAPADTTVWGGEWFGKGFGPARLDETCMAEGCIPTHDSVKFPGSEFFRIFVQRPSGVETYKIHQGVPLKERGIYVFDYATKDIVQIPQLIKTMPLGINGVKASVVQVKLNVTGIPIDVAKWKVICGTQIPNIDISTSATKKGNDASVTVKASMVGSLRFEAWDKNGRPLNGNRWARYNWFLVRGGAAYTVSMV